MLNTSLQVKSYKIFRISTDICLYYIFVICCCCHICKNLSIVFINSRRVKALMIID
ncbi:hypothetical protein DICPUDRAFT_158745 [Dictyostelium purpureum]|uniref:Uncharacterized protein n=1 Tax=Dictyostelium purpureum TaxID=5786 RepID=F1A2D2_DICPU|nr:uncharacterized protein DICPUDRAFT_158745 [Dictyostelium purpureum]EGC29653.1 hypothetical protein DICPUDRAFT_158745 [Dictyostelium purpureum]|eukprot:XP_003293822.1 hypothetical protein DICPUDRAFT_158745 [Dictyostelium purpureum]